MEQITNATRINAHSATAYWTPGGSFWLAAYFQGTNTLSRRNMNPQTGSQNNPGRVDLLDQNTPYDLYVYDPRSPDPLISDPWPISTRSNSQLSFFKERLFANSPQGSEVTYAAEISLSPATDQRIFDLLVPEGKFVGHYVRQGTNGGWRRVDTLVLPDGQQIPDTAVSHIQSFTALDHLDALALLQPGGALVTFEYNPDTGKHQASPVTVNLPSVHGGEPVNQVTGIPALVQTDQKLFHLLVPHQSGPEESGQPAPIRIVHLVHSNETIQGPWDFVTALPPIPQGSGVVSIALTQADGLGSLKAVVRITPLRGPDFLVSYQSDPNYNWQGPFPVSTAVIIGPAVSTFPQEQDTTENNPGTPGYESSFALTTLHTPDTISNVAGSPGLAQSIFGDQEQLDLIVPIADPRTGTITLTQFTQPAGFEVSVNQPWTLAATLQPLNNDAHTQVVSTSIIQDSHRDLQNIAHVITPQGENLLAFYIFNPQTGWSSPTLVTKPDGKPIIVGHDNGPSDENGDNSDDHHDNGDPDHISYS